MPKRIQPSRTAKKLVPYHVPSSSRMIVYVRDSLNRACVDLDEMEDLVRRLKVRARNGLPLQEVVHRLTDIDGRVEKIREAISQRIGFITHPLYMKTGMRSRFKLLNSRKRQLYQEFAHWVL